MNANQFDQITRSMGKSSTRREALKVLAGGLLAGFGALFHRANGLEQASAQTEQENVIYLPVINQEGQDVQEVLEEITDAQLQAISQEAGQNQKFKLLQQMFLNRGDIESSRSGGVLKANGELIRQLLAVEFNAESPSTDKSFILFSQNPSGPSYVAGFRYLASQEVILGFYFDGSGTMQTSAYPLPAAQGSSTLTASAVPSSNQNITESCQICLDSCIETAELRATTCLIRLAVKASKLSQLLVGKQAKDLLKDGILASWGPEIKEYAEEYYFMYSSAKRLGECLGKLSGAVDCTPTGQMCKDVCEGCTQSGTGPNGCGYTFASLCVGNECLQVCGDVTCRVNETCSPEKTCVPIEDTCKPYTYVGMYWYPGGKRLTPACCAVAGGINCGAQDNGMWGGCCPANTTCLPIEGGGYGCCLIGLDCEV